MHSAFNSSVFDKVLLAVQRTVHAKPPLLSHSTRLVKDLMLSRLGFMKLALCLEEAFDIELQDDVVERFDTIDDIVAYLSRRYFRDVEPHALTAAA